MKVWNAQTAELKRKIGYPGRDVHDLLGLSQDGRVIVGYIGKEGAKWHWDFESEPDLLDEKFAVWMPQTAASLPFLKI